MAEVSAARATSAGLATHCRGACPATILPTKNVQTTVAVEFRNRDCEHVAINHYQIGTLTGHQRAGLIELVQDPCRLCLRRRRRHTFAVRSPKRRAHHPEAVARHITALSTYLGMHL